jgi:hypothetical protein
MNHMLVAALALALVLAVLVLIRETRLRRALQKLLQIMLSNWRSHANKTSNDDAGRPDGGGPDERLR